MITQHDIYRAASGEYRCRNCDTPAYSLFVDRGRSCPGAQQVARPATGWKYDNPLASVETPLYRRMSDFMRDARGKMEAEEAAARPATPEPSDGGARKLREHLERPSPLLKRMHDSMAAAKRAMDATPEPPEWRGVPGAQMIVPLGTVPKGAVLRGIGPDGPIYDTPATVTNTGVIQTEATPSPLDLIRGKPGPVTGRQLAAEANFLSRQEADFIAKRKAKREPLGYRDAADDGHEWAYHVDACSKCGFTSCDYSAIGDAGPFPRCEAVKADKDRTAPIARAFSLPISFTQRLGVKT